MRHATLPAPGGDAELLDWMGDFFSHRLDRSRPLWEITLLDGLADGRWSLVTKVHHCLVDGMSGVSVTNLILDAVPRALPARGRPGCSAPLPPIAAPAGRHGGPATLARGARAGLDFALHPGKVRDALGQTRALAEFIVRDEVIPAPHTSLNVPIGGNRRMNMVAAPLADLKAIKSRLGGSVNDVVLAIAAGGLRHLLESRGEALPRRGIRVMVPVSVRQASEATVARQPRQLAVRRPARRRARMRSRATGRRWRPQRR